MLSNMQQKSTKGKKLKGRSERQPNQTLCGVRSWTPWKLIEKRNGQKQDEQ
jgi:hypothetical protein